MKLEFNRLEKPFLFKVKNEVGAELLMDAAPKIGGTNKGLRPMELVAAGVAGCVSIDVLLILKKQKIDTDAFSISIEANRKEGIPSPFENIHLKFEVDNSVNKEKLSKNIRLVLDKYCSVSASLDQSIEITFEIISNET